MFTRLCRIHHIVISFLFKVATVRLLGGWSFLEINIFVENNENKNKNTELKKIKLSIFLVK